MNTDSSIIYPLALVTFLLAVVIAFWVLNRTQKAKRNHEHSAMTAPGAHGDLSKDRRNAG